MNLFYIISAICFYSGILPFNIYVCYLKASYKPQNFRLSLDGKFFSDWNLVSNSPSDVFFDRQTIKAYVPEHINKLTFKCSIFSLIENKHIDSIYAKFPMETKPYEMKKFFFSYK